ncbi:type II and III secretion system protein family protein [Noviherbaspirillum soli]|uniref:type II and III secretion system protein family protein n=1 Tax=Noviherbaspirillum soli TaxID=1064518 RepID=UPI00188AEFB8|nr:type II and III secretion system protein family protein [Noviherbaspirillum soli]
MQRRPSCCRLPVLALLLAPPWVLAAPAAPGQAQQPAPRVQAAPPCIGEMDTAAPLSVAQGKSLMLDLRRHGMPSPAWLRAVGDTDVLQLEPTASAAPRAMFFLFGKKVGATNLLFQNGDGKCGWVEVAVGIDAGAVEARLRQLLPHEAGIRVGAAADSLVLSGLASDAAAAEQALLVAEAYAQRGNAAASSGSGTGNARVINLLSIASPQQVMLEVKVAEVSRSLLEKLGVDVALGRGRGNWSTRLAAQFVTGANGTLGIVKNSGEFISLDAEKGDGLVRILAEPTIMAVSGQEGSFLAGGRIFIPVAQNSINGTVTLEEKEFGVGLRFTPTVLGGGRINIRVAPEVSELSREGVGLSARGTGGNAVLPLLTTRRASTTVQLQDGQSLAIGGLIRDNLTQNIRALPVLGEVPVLGALFRSSDFQNDRSELVFIVTPRLVQPLQADAPLPTDGLRMPSRAEFFLGGKMEAAPAATSARE